MTKALVCGKCFDIRALDPDGDWVACRCGICQARWEDPHRGTVRCRIVSHPLVESANVPLRIMGLSNSYFIPALKGPSWEEMVEVGGQWPWWQKLAERAIDAPGYIFDRSMRATWATIVKVNETADIKWEDPIEVEAPKPEGTL